MSTRRADRPAARRAAATGRLDRRPARDLAEGRAGSSRRSSRRSSPSSSGASWSRRPAPIRSTRTAASGPAPASSGSSRSAPSRPAFRSPTAEIWFPWDPSSRAAREPPADAAPDLDAHPHRPRGRVRVPLRALQHRRPGPVLRRRLPRDLDRLVVRRDVELPAHRSSPSSWPAWAGRSGRGSRGS